MSQPENDFEKQQRRLDMIDYLLMSINRTKNYKRQCEAIERFAETVLRRGW